MKKVIVYCWLFEPVRGTFQDSDDAIPAFSVDIDTPWGSGSLALFADEHLTPTYARLTLPLTGEAEEIEDWHLPVIHSVREHLLSVLRVTFHANVMLFPHPIWFFVNDGESYRNRLDITITAEPATLNVEETRDLMTASFEHREELRLFLDGGDARIPLQYRYLSFYRLLELLAKINDEWDEAVLDSAFEPHRQRLLEAGFPRKPVNTLHELRDSCAHIRTGSRFGVTHLNRDMAAKVELFLPVLQEVCATLLTQTAGGRFGIGVGKPPARP